MNTNQLKKFAQAARRTLMDQVTAQLGVALAEGSLARRESPKAIEDLEREIRDHGKDATVEKAAYTWFNRFTALMYMDATGLTAVRATLPAEGETVPQILSDAKSGEFEGEIPEKIQQRVTGLLDGDISSRDPEGEAYRLLLVSECNHWHHGMPFMFERIADWTELLMPADLLSNTSVLAQMREVMTEDACGDVEIIGWLYQFYISEKKDQVFAGLKKNQKITAENIPAATQLFTPHWIVRYLVENSLGRLWLLNRPDSRLVERMDYYIAPEEPETDFLKIVRPEEIRICDPAVGSGHMLTYAFDLLYAIYEEGGYDPTEIPALILTHNLTGVEIDDRAGALAAFALMMKAAARLGRRRFLRMEARPRICVLQSVAFSDAEMQDVVAVVGRDLFTDELRETLLQFEQAKNFGSLIVPKLRDPAETLRVAKARDLGSDLLLREVQERVVSVLRMAEALSPKYHVVLANPPYMGGKGMNGTLSEFVKTEFKDAKSDLFSAFIERGHDLVHAHGFNSMVTMESWMFLSSFEKMRTKLLSRATIRSMVHMPYLGRGGTSMGINFGTTAFITCKTYEPCFKGDYCCVRYFETDDVGVPLSFPPENERLSQAATEDFGKIPGSPIAYWISDRLLTVFSGFDQLKEHAHPRQGMATTNNDLFLRLWFEVQHSKCGFGLSPQEGGTSDSKWFPLNKGGEFRRWYGNNIFVVNYENNGRTICDFIDNTPGVKVKSNGRVINRDRYFHEGLTWSTISSADFSLRFSPEGSLFETKGAMIFFDDHTKTKAVLGLLNTKITGHLLKATSPTLDFHEGPLGRLPILISQVTINAESKARAEKAVHLSKLDWDAYETSWDFTTLPLLFPEHRGETLEDSYATLRTHWQSMTDEMKAVEQENNRIFIDAYGLQDELTPEVPIEEITLTCNPAYRYGVKGSEEDLETRLLADTMAEFLSYAVGCMFGRYSLDTPGLILANQGERLEDYLAILESKGAPSPSFTPDTDNVIPVLDGDWFADDITERFRLFLTVTFGKDRFADNLAFIEEALGKDIRKYFLRDFYKDHVKRYKKRPIYWMFSSPKGSFNALIYMHRYRPDTVSVILNDYLREFRSKITVARKECERVEASADASQREKVQAGKNRMRYDEILLEIDSWEKDVLFPLATQNLAIDLDDGVKVNYPKFGDALARIPGLEASDE
jgi:hypothetical protein